MLFHIHIRKCFHFIVTIFIFLLFFSLPAFPLEPGIITTIVGNGKAGFSGDGDLATKASLGSPMSVCVDNEGNIFIADAGNYRVRGWAVRLRQARTPDLKVKRDSCFVFSDNTQHAIRPYPNPPREQGESGCIAHHVSCITFHVLLTNGASSRECIGHRPG